MSRLPIALQTELIPMHLTAKPSQFGQAVTFGMWFSLPTSPFHEILLAKGRPLSWHVFGGDWATAWTMPLLVFYGSPEANESLGKVLLKGFPKRKKKQIGNAQAVNQKGCGGAWKSVGYHERDFYLKLSWIKSPDFCFNYRSLVFLSKCSDCSMAHSWHREP